jgi:hypothetical protein
MMDNVQKHNICTKSGTFHLVVDHEIFSHGDAGCFGNRDGKRTPGVRNYTTTWTQRTVCISGIYINE